MFQIFKKHKHRYASQIDPHNLPVHIGIIMDGNGRWAKKRGLPRSAGHTMGARVLEQITRAAGNIGIKYLTVYAFSTENWARPADEVNSLMKLIGEYLDDYRRIIGDEDMRVRFIGSKNGLNDDILEKMRVVEDATKDNKSITLNIALNYGGRDEIVNSVKQIAQKIKNCELDENDINEQLLSDHMYTYYMPDPDFIIRPSGEQRLSNFLLWQSAYSEFWYSNINWPDFTKDDLEKAIVDYQNRNRRFGGV